MQEISGPIGLFVSQQEIYFCDAENHRIRKVLSNGQVVTIAGTGTSGFNGDNQPATQAHIHYPVGVFVTSRDEVYICEGQGSRIRKIGVDGCIVTVAGTGVDGYTGDGGLATEASIGSCGIFVTEDNEVYSAEWTNGCIRKISQNGIITTIAAEEGDLPSAVFVTPSKEVYYTECGKGCVKKIGRDGTIELIAGCEDGDETSDGIPALKAKINNPYDLQVTPSGEIFISEHGGGKIRKINLDGTIETIAGKSSVDDDDEYVADDDIQCCGLFVTEIGEVYFTSDRRHCIKKIDEGGNLKNIIGTGKSGYSGDIPFDFKMYPHKGPRNRKPFSRREGNFVKAYHDIQIKCSEDWW